MKARSALLRLRDAITVLIPMLFDFDKSVSMWFEERTSNFLGISCLDIYFTSDNDNLTWIN